MLKNYVAGITLFALCSNLYAANTIEIVSEDKVVPCQKMASEVCTTEKRDETKAIKKCDNWHQKQASKQGANRIVITNTTFDERRRAHYDGSIKTIITREFFADYYACDDALVAQQTSAPQQQPDAAAASSKPSIEQRLLTLQALKDKGLITEQEYETKRTEILSEL